MDDSQVIADLHLHSKYSRAVSKSMVVAEMADWARKKGIGLVATGDWLHTIWFRELQSSLLEVSDGIYQYRGAAADRRASSVEVLSGTESVEDRVRFLLSAEISSIYKQGGKLRRVHTVLLAPNFSTAEKVKQELLKRGCNLASDGRPIVGLSAREVAEVVLSIDEDCMVLPAHVWTPHFSVYGSNSGFDSIEECYGELADKIYAVETGLSSDPGMNWRVSELEKRAIVSFSDAHSPSKLGREATVFKSLGRRAKGKEYTYGDIYWAIAERFLGKNEGGLKLAYTIEFYPEEGKYHYSGHRKCNVVQSPQETEKKGAVCSVCGKPLTLGVEHRVEELSGKKLTPIKKSGKSGLSYYVHPTDKSRPGYVMLVPLVEILAEVWGVGAASKKVDGEYERLVNSLGNEFNVLMKSGIEEIGRIGGEKLAEAIEKVREGSIYIMPGYDGVFGEVKIWKEDNGEQEKAKEQMTLF